MVLGSLWSKTGIASTPIPLTAVSFSYSSSSPIAAQQTMFSLGSSAKHAHQVLLGTARALRRPVTVSHLRLFGSSGSRRGTSVPDLLCMPPFAWRGRTPAAEARPAQGQPLPGAAHVPAHTLKQSVHFRWSQPALAQLK